MNRIKFGLLSKTRKVTTEVQGENLLELRNLVLWPLVVLVNELLLASEEGELWVSEGDELLRRSLGVAGVQQQVRVQEVLATHLTPPHYPFAVLGLLVLSVKVWMIYVTSVERL